MVSLVVCPTCGNDDQAQIKTDATPGRAPTRNRPGVSAVLHGWICGKCGTKIPELPTTRERLDLARRKREE